MHSDTRKCVVDKVSGTPTVASHEEAIRYGVKEYGVNGVWLPGQRKKIVTV